MHSLMKTTFHEQQRVPPQQVWYRGRVATLKKLPFVLQNEPVRFRVSREHCWFAKNMGCEYGAEPGHPLIDKGFWVLSLVSWNKLQSLPNKGKPKIPRWQSQPPATWGTKKEEKGGRENHKEKWVQKERHEKFQFLPWKLV